MILLRPESSGPPRVGMDKTLTIPRQDKGHHPLRPWSLTLTASFNTTPSTSFRIPATSTGRLGRESGHPTIMSCIFLAMPRTTATRSRNEVGSSASLLFRCCGLGLLDELLRGRPETGSSPAPVGCPTIHPRPKLGVHIRNVEDAGASEVAPHLQGEETMEVPNATYFSSMRGRDNARRAFILPLYVGCFGHQLYFSVLLVHERFRSNLNLSQILLEVWSEQVPCLSAPWPQAE